MTAVETPVMIGGKPWADQPYTLITTEEWKTRDVKEHSSIVIALEMVRVHNCFIRCFNAIVLQGPNVKEPQDVKGFFHFIHCTAYSVHHHHALEEKIFFPHVSKLTGKPDLMEANIGQHKGFTDGMHELDEYVTKTKPEDYSWPALKKIIDTFAPDLMEHLVAEIPTILELQSYDSAKLMEGWKATEKEALKALEGEAIKEWAPLIFTVSDKTYENGFHKNFPPTPFFVPYLVNYVFSRRHAGAWRFGPCDFYGKPRPLPFA